MMDICCQQCGKKIAEAEGRVAWVCPRCKRYNTVTTTPRVKA